MKVLWLASWYPNNTNPFDGDFIERHAIAVSRLLPLTVLFVAKDSNMPRGASCIEKTVNGNLTVYKGYYGTSSSSKIIEQALSFRKYKKFQQRMYAQVIKEQGEPNLVHVQVAMKAGLLALHLKKKCSIPFVVTEHWTGYFKTNRPNVYSGNFLINSLNKKILQQARLLLAVSNNLGATVNANFVKLPYTVISNVVDTSLFFYKAPVQQQRFRFIHPSVLSWQKNPEGMLQACKLVKKRGYDFELVMAGAAGKELESLASQPELRDNIVFKGMIPYNEVAIQMQQSNALLLFSRNENMPCVILEALCCGLPVIATHVGGIPEVIDEHNGILVESENVQQLADAMIQMIERYNSYNLPSISKNAIQKFNYDAVAKQHIAIYEKLLTAQQV